MRSFLSYGFRPFFLGATIWAALAMLLWVLMLAGQLALPTRFDLVSWHAHEFLFGTLIAIIAGFLLTAVPSWTDRPPLAGWLLGALALVWVAGRIAIAISAWMPWGAVAFIDLVFSVMLGVVILREIVLGRKWKNLVVMALLAVFTIANGLFHLEAANGDIAAQGIGLRLGLATAVMMIALIGGRVVPAFTRNWLTEKGRIARIAAPMQRFDKAVLLITLAVLGQWVLRPDIESTGVLLIAVGVLHVLRLARWRGCQTAAEPLVLVLHLGYGFVPLGALTIGCATLFPQILAPRVAQHVWMAGAIGLMTLAVMTRATLGHSGRALHAGAGSVALFVLLLLSVIARLCAAHWPDLRLLEAAALFWIGAFGGFAVLYAPLLIQAKPKN